VTIPFFHAFRGVYVRLRTVLIEGDFNLSLPAYFDCSGYSSEESLPFLPLSDSLVMDSSLFSVRSSLAAEGLSA